MLCFFFTSACVCGQAVSFKIKKPNQVEFARQFNIEMQVSHSADYLLKPDEKSFDIKDFRITAVETAEPEVDGDKTKQVFTLTVVPFVLGETVFPRLNWFLTDKKSGEVKQLKNPEVPLEITEIQKPKELKSEIYDIFDIYRPFNYLLVGLLVLSVLAAGVAAYFLIRKKRKHIFAAISQDSRSPDVIALEEIEKLLDSTLWQEEKVKVFYIELSGILRDYLEKRFKIAAHKFTSLDLCRKLKVKLTDKTLVSLVREFFYSCDMVKFAKYKPSCGQRDKDIGHLKNIVAQTSPKTTDTDKQI